MKSNSIVQVIFKGAYWLRYWAQATQLQRDEIAKDALSTMSKKLEVIALGYPIDDGNIFIV
jgi:hypothetical protein